MRSPIASETAYMQSESELIQGVIQKDPTAFALLIKPYERELNIYLRRYLRNYEDTQDAYQNMCIKVVTKMDTFNHTERLRPWLYTIATRAAIDVLRKKKRGKAKTYQLDENTGGSHVNVGNTITPELHAIASESRTNLHAAVTLLTENQREVISLVYMQGMKYKEVAAAIGIPVGTVKSRLHTAIQKLQELYDVK